MPSRDEFALTLPGPPGRPGGSESIGAAGVVDADLLHALSLTRMDSECSASAPDFRGLRTLPGENAAGAIPT